MARLKNAEWVIGLTGSQLDHELLQAYLETEYRAAELVLRIGESNDGLRQAHAHRGVTSSAFVTAWNPYGQSLSSPENGQRHAQLKQLVYARSWQALEGIGQHPNNGWDGEESLLIFGLSLDHAEVVGRQFEQNAIVWADEDAVPRLVLLR
jgi:hypothetical protein